MVKQCVDSESRLVALRRPIQSQKEVVTELYDQRLIHRRGLGAFLPDKPLSDTYDIFLVDLGCFTSLINQGRLRLIDHGLRDRGIALVNQDKANRRESGTGKKASYALMPSADRWR